MEPVEVPRISLMRKLNGVEMSEDQDIYACLSSELIRKNYVHFLIQMDRGISEYTTASLDQGQNKKVVFAKAAELLSKRYSNNPSENAKVSKRLTKLLNPNADKRNIDIDDIELAAKLSKLPPDVVFRRIAMSDKTSDYRKLDQVYDLRPNFGAILQYYREVETDLRSSLVMALYEDHSLKKERFTVCLYYLTQIPEVQFESIFNLISSMVKQDDPIKRVN